VTRPVGLGGRARPWCGPSEGPTSGEIEGERVASGDSDGENDGDIAAANSWLMGERGMWCEERATGAMERGATLAEEHFSPAA
jgi:hypothetical protein